MEARSRNITQELIEKEMKNVKENILKNGYDLYLDDYDIGEEMIKNYLGKDFIVKYSSSLDYTMYRIYPVKRRLK
jgi:hypothetical protein